MHKPLTLLLLLALTCWACSKGTSANGRDAQTPAQETASASGDLKFKVPEGWIVEHPTSSMRTAQYKLPKATGDSEDASLVVYYFGKGQGGGTQANIDRWVGQMQQPDGKPSSEKAKTETLTVNGLKVSTVDVSGNYSAEMTPGSGTFSNNSNYRLRAAVVETPKGSYFVKLVGPEKTVTQWNDAFISYVKSFEFK